MENETRYLAIDYGEKRIGLALTDPLKILASPFKTIANDVAFLENLQTIIREKSISKIILGIPFCDNGSDTKLTKKVRELREILMKLTGIEVILVDERYSSSIASERIIQSVAKKSKRREKSLVDKNAAAVLLEDYLKSEVR